MVADKTLRGGSVAFVWNPCQLLLAAESLVSLCKSCSESSGIHKVGLPRLLLPVFTFMNNAWKHLSSRDSSLVWLC